MRKLITFALAATAACACFAADPAFTRFTDVAYTTSGTVSGRTVVTANALGYVDEILFDVTGTAGCTGRVEVYTQPPIPSMAVVMLATNYALTGDSTIRVRFDSTGIGGSANSSDPPERFLLWGPVYFAVTNSTHTTNVTFKCGVKTVR